ncbi:MAG: hypothetical protein HEP71_03220 [Roseivirga sp.]|nr:hypothetical protein [Roseivirga sp.]
MKELIQDLNIDKTTWKLTKFGDVAIQQKKTLDRENTSITRYVKGEHMASEDIHLRQWGELKDEYLGPAFIRYFEEGDILYGSRRTYLKKVTVAPFSGITSNTTFVIKANEEILDKRLLPFLMLSDGFTEHSVRNSKGSVNPYINWKDVANYEFLLPPLAEQARLAELLWAMDKVIQESKSLEVSLLNTKKSEFKEYIFESSDTNDQRFGQLKSKHPVRKLDKLITQLQYGISESLLDKGEIPVLRMNNLQDGKLDLTDLKFYNQRKGEIDQFILNQGDILFNRTNSFELVGKVSLFQEPFKCSFASYLIRIKTDPNKLDPRYLNTFLNSSIGLAKIRKYRTPGVSQSNINAQSLRKLDLPLPALAEQIILMNKLDQLNELIECCQSKKSSSKALLQSMIHEVF